jgi:inorganic pyrophosphatase
MITLYQLTDISDIPSYMKHSLKNLFKSYCIYTTGQNIKTFIN